MAERLPVGATRTARTPSFSSLAINPISPDVFNRLINSESTTRTTGRTKEGEARQEHEWVEQDEPGVYITFVSLPGGIKDLKRVRFSRKRFSEKQAEQWWAENRARVCEQYKVLDKLSAGVESEDQSSLVSWKASSVG